MIWPAAASDASMAAVKDLSDIGQRARDLLRQLPAGVTLVAAAKSRTPQQVRAALDAGIADIGHNYVQEAQAGIAALGREAARWHLIGHLQRNKVKRAVQLFDIIESVDSARLADALESACAAAGRVMPVLVEVNSAAEQQKTGVWPGRVEALVCHLAGCEHLRVEGLMTLGRFAPDPEACRPSFRLMRQLFEDISRAAIPGVRMRWLSMGMSDSWLVAVEEGANMVRIGTALFGPRQG